MDNLITLRTELEQEIARQGYSLSSFSNASGINRGILSATLNGNPPKPMSINQLDRMGTALGKPEGWLYEQFIEESFIDGKANWRRIRPLLLRCMELHRNDLIERTLYLLMEDPNHIGHVFELAEEQVQAGFAVETVPLYTCVVENERNYQSERLAISQYRIFRASIGHNIEDNLKAALIFEPFRNRLPDYLKLDALLKLINVNYTVQNWDHASQLARELHSLASHIHQQKLQAKAKNKPFKMPAAERPLLLYYGQSLLMQFVANEYQEKYETARTYLEQFSDLHWFEDDHPENKNYIEFFKFFGMFNALNLDILTGNEHKLTDYFELLKKHPEEALPSLLMIIGAANKHGYDIDHFLAYYDDIIYPADIMDYLIKGKSIKHNYQDIPIGISRYVNIYYQLATYHCDRKIYDKKLEKVLYALESTVEKYNRGRIMDCLNLFKKLRSLR
ncbi:DNA-binding protein [Paenibacillus sp. Z6-24]